MIQYNKLDKNDKFSSLIICKLNLYMKIDERINKKFDIIIPASIKVFPGINNDKNSEIQSLFLLTR